jgi:hypothetical protein
MIPAIITIRKPNPAPSGHYRYCQHHEQDGYNQDFFHLKSFLHLIIS